MSLRNAIFAYAIVATLAGVIVLAILGPLLGGSVWTSIGIYVLASGVVCGAALVFERSRYRPRASAPSRLRPSGERMIDPVSSRLVEVWEDPVTGEREYRDAEDHSVRK